MNRILLAGLGMILVGTAWAEPPKPAAAACIDPHKSYVAHPLTQHEVYVKQSMGKEKPPVRLTTSCIHLEPAMGFGFSAQYTCIDLGDSVVATMNGGSRESCKVTRVRPYAPEPGDFKTY